MPEARTWACDAPPACVTWRHLSGDPIMRAARTLMLFALLPLFTACQLFESEPAKPSTAGLTRMQGELTAVAGKLLFQPCHDQRNYVVRDTGGTSILQEAASLASKAHCLPTCAASYPASPPAPRAKWSCNSCTASSARSRPAMIPTSSARSCAPTATSRPGR